MTIIISPDYSTRYGEHGGLWGDSRINNLSSQDPFSPASKFWGHKLSFKDQFLIEENLDKDNVVLGAKLPVTGKIYSTELLCLQKADTNDYELNLVLLSSNKTTAVIKEILIDSIMGTDATNTYYSKFPLTVDMDINDFIGLVNISDHTILPTSEYSLTIDFVEG